MLDHHRVQRRLIMQTLVPGFEPPRESGVDLFAKRLPPVSPTRWRRSFLMEQKLQLPPNRAEIEPLLEWGVQRRQAVTDLRTERIPPASLRCERVRLDPGTGPLDFAR